MKNFKGWLLLDVDGPLNPYACNPNRPPSGFESWRRLPGGKWLPGKEAKKLYRSRNLKEGLLVRLNPNHGAAIKATADAAGLDVAWATTWMDEANTLIGRTIGLPDLPVVPFPPGDLDTSGDHPVWVRSGGWKWAGVGEFAAGAPVAWLDDEFAASDSARNKFLSGRNGSPTLLHYVSPRTGITDADLAAITDWANAL